MRLAYPGLSRRSEQLSCSKFFDPSYGYFSMIFQSFNNHLELIKSENQLLQQQ